MEGRVKAKTKGRLNTAGPVFFEIRMSRVSTGRLHKVDWSKSLK